MTEALDAGETVRAEEMVLSVPDGRSVTVLLNVTPIRSDEGTLEAFVVTLQDMTTLEDLERLGDEATDPRYIFAESRVGYRMPPSRPPAHERDIIRGSERSTIRGFEHNKIRGFKHNTIRGFERAAG